jgi:polysaccharide biosynthesis protein PslG
MTVRPNLLRRLLIKATVAVAALGAGAALLVAATPAGAAETGLNVAGFFGTPAQNAQLESLIDRLHPAWVRVFLNWNQVELGPGSYNLGQLSDYKALFGALPAGTKVDIDVVGSPAWANGGSSSTATPPVSDQSFAAFMNYLANTFGPSVTAYEIWNEEDNSAWWTGSAAQYAGLIGAAYPAIKAANHNATVILGGLAANDYPYLAQLYAAGVRGSFNGVAVHTDDACSLDSPYAFAFNPGTQAINRWSFLGFSTVHAVMAANGDAAVPLYMTEFGWSTTTSTCSGGVSAGKKAGGVSQQKQATYLQQAYHCLDQPQYSYVAAAMWFDMVDFAPQNVFYNRYGLLTASLRPKASFKAFRQEATSGDKLAGGCGNFAGPNLHLVSPANGETYSGPLEIRVSARANGAAVAQIALLHDGHDILNFNRVDAHYKKGILSGTIDWQGARWLALGTHTITVVATDANGVKATESVTVDHVAGAKHKARGKSKTVERHH